MGWLSSLETLIRRYYRTTGVPVLDDMIYGWPRKGLALIYGSQKAGKTTLAMQAAVHTVLDEGRQVLYLDTESGGASELRLYTLASALGVSEADIPSVVSRITIFKAYDLGDQHRIITEDWGEITQTGEVGMFAVDSVAWHYHQRVMNTPSEMVGAVARELLGRLEMEIKTLLKYAEKTGASIIYTSWSASKAKKAFEEHQRRELEKAARKGFVDTRDLDVVLGTYGEDYIGGRFIGYMAKVIARIWRLQGDLRFFVVEAHREKRDNIGIYMRVSEKGLHPVDGAKPVPVESEMRRRLIAEEEKAVEADAAEVEKKVKHPPGSGAAVEKGRRPRSGARQS
jgi:RecA/RadA recombinase